MCVFVPRGWRYALCAVETGVQTCALPVLRDRCGGARAAHRPSGRKAAAAGGAGDRRDRETKASTLGLTPHHFLRPNEAAKRLLVHKPKLQTRFQQGLARGMSVLCNAGGVVIAKLRRKRGDQHQRLFQECREDRKSVVEGKSVSVRVEHGGRRYLK